MAKKEKLTMTIDPEVRAKLEIEAKKRGRSLSNFVNYILKLSLRKIGEI